MAAWRLDTDTQGIVPCNECTCRSASTYLRCVGLRKKGKLEPMLTHGTDIHPTPVRFLFDERISVLSRAHSKWAYRNASMQPRCIGRRINKSEPAAPAQHGVSGPDVKLPSSDPKFMAPRFTLARLLPLSKGFLESTELLYKHVLSGPCL